MQLFMPDLCLKGLPRNETGMYSTHIESILTREKVSINFKVCLRRKVFRYNDTKFAELVFAYRGIRMAAGTKRKA